MKIGDKVRFLSEVGVALSGDFKERTLLWWKEKMVLKFLC